MTAALKLTFDNGNFIGKCLFEHRQIFKDAGFRWDLTSKVWYTPNPKIAASLRIHADEAAKKEIDKRFIKISEWTAAIPYPKNLTPYGFQLNVAVPFALARNRSYLGLDPGCGKTICAAMYLNALFTAGEIHQCLYVCPPFLIPNVIAELEKWCTFSPNIFRFRSSGMEPGAGNFEILLIPDSLIASKVGGVRMFVDEYVKDSRKAAIIVDEAHRFKNADSQRSEALYEGLLPYFDRAVFLSGTPMPNYPMELFAVLNAAAPETIGFRKKFDYGRYFCAGFQTDFGWDFTGASNLHELLPPVKEKFLLRIKKKDVLPELPEKIEQLIFMDEEAPPAIQNFEKKILAYYSPEDLAKYELGDQHVATYRKTLGTLKVEFASKFIRELLDSSGESVLVFCHHRDVVADLTWQLRTFEPLVIAGFVPSDVRAARAKEFQEDKTKRVVILNIQAGGIGYNLTKASRVFFVEYSWNPAENEQAIDRAHRIGQKQCVFAQYLVYPHSLDARMLELNLNKRKVTNKL